MRTNQAEMEKLIQKGQSMIEGTSVDVRLRNRQMEVSMSAVPKEMDDREILTARIAAGDRVYEQVMDGDNIEKAEFIVENSGIVERPPSGMKSGSGWGGGVAEEGEAV